jgi:hypothetical protein
MKETMAFAPFWPMRAAPPARANATGASMRGIVRGLSFGYFLAVAAFGAMILEPKILALDVSESVRLHLRALDSEITKVVPLRGSQDIDAPLLLPFETPDAPEKAAPRRHRASPATELASRSALDTFVNAG